MACRNCPFNHNGFCVNSDIYIEDMRFKECESVEEIREEEYNIAKILMEYFDIADEIHNIIEIKEDIDLEDI